MKPSILFLAGHLPAPNGNQAGMKSSYHLCRVLSRSFEIHLLCFVTGDELPFYQPNAHDVFRSQEILMVTNRLRAVGALTAPGLPLAVSARNSREFRRRLARKISSHEFKIAILDHTNMWQYAGACSGIPVVCGLAQDVLSQLWERRGNLARGWSAPLLRLEASRVRKWETLALTEMTMAATFCEKDAALLVELAPGTSVHSVQPWFSNLAAQVNLDDEHRRCGKNVVFWGALNREENQDCVRFALEEILPLVRKRFPDIHFYIAGAATDALIAEWAGPGITVTGFVKDVGALFAKMDIALLPLRLGAGIKIKTLESMSAGLAVVTTAVGIEGIPARRGSDYLLGESPQELAAHVIALLSDQSLCKKMGRSAQEFIRNDFDFDKAAERFSVALLGRLGSREDGGNN